MAQEHRWSNKYLLKQWSHINGETGVSDIKTLERKAKLFKVKGISRNGKHLTPETCLDNHLLLQYFRVPGTISSQLALEKNKTEFKHIASFKKGIMETRALV